MLGISKRGNRYLRTLLICGARAALGRQSAIGGFEGADNSAKVTERGRNGRRLGSPAENVALNAAVFITPEPRGTIVARNDLRQFVQTGHTFFLRPVSFSKAGVYR
ncbi:hypothetical protein I6F26_29265 [Ensifer sp. IC3342]|nr:hypothetical protein [Ensifer sp. BRP08]MCA1450628.1 hypothetical protein [Ensifer sp. IC3342]